MQNILSINSKVENLINLLDNDDIELISQILGYTKLDSIELLTELNRKQLEVINRKKKVDLSKKLHEKRKIEETVIEEIEPEVIEVEEITEEKIVEYTDSEKVLIAKLKEANELYLNTTIEKNDREFAKLILDGKDEDVIGLFKKEDPMLCYRVLISYFHYVLKQLTPEFLKEEIDNIENRFIEFEEVVELVNENLKREAVRQKIVKDNELKVIDIEKTLETEKNILLKELNIYKIK